MGHGTARLNAYGRWLIVHRVRFEGWAVAHAAKAMGVSRQCAHRWLNRWDAEGAAGLEDRSSRPHCSPTRTAVEVEQEVVAARRRLRVGQDFLSDELGIPARTISRVLRRYDMAYLRDLDPLTGRVIRASKTTATRYERERPGELVHVDVKKIGRIPVGGGWRAWGRDATRRDKKARIGYDYIHSAVDDHSRVAYSEIHDDEKDDTAAGFLARAAEFFASHGVEIEAVMTDNHLSYTNSHAVRDVLNDLGARHVRIRPHCPWQNGKVERLNRTLQTEWAYRRIYRTNHERRAALQPWLQHYNTRRKHGSLGRQPPISRLSPT